MAEKEGVGLTKRALKKRSITPTGNRENRAHPFFVHSAYSAYSLFYGLRIFRINRLFDAKESRWLSVSLVFTERMVGGIPSGFGRVYNRGKHRADGGPMGYGLVAPSPCF